MLESISYDVGRNYRLEVKCYTRWQLCKDHFPLCYIQVISLPYQVKNSSNTASIVFQVPTYCTGFTYHQHCREGRLLNHWPLVFKLTLLPYTGGGSPSTPRTSTSVSTKTFRIMTAGGSGLPRDTGQLLLKLSISVTGPVLIVLTDSPAPSSCCEPGRSYHGFIVNNTVSLSISVLPAANFMTISSTHYIVSSYIAAP